MSEDYTVVDALTYTREKLQHNVDWIQEYLAEHYAIEISYAQEELPAPLKNVLDSLTYLLCEVNDMALQTGDYELRNDGQLMRPVYYSTAQPVYEHGCAETGKEEIRTTCLVHPSQQPFFPVDPDTRRWMDMFHEGGSNE